jgi:hypothetical protein
VKYLNEQLEKTSKEQEQELQKLQKCLKNIWIYMIDWEIFRFL